MTIEQEPAGRKPQNTGFLPDEDLRLKGRRRPKPDDPSRTQATKRVFVDVATDDIVESATNMHREPDEDLVRSITKHGVIEPILVRPINAVLVTESGGGQRSAHFEIVHGERRWKGNRTAGHATIIAELRELTDDEALDLQVEENLQRADLTPLQEAFCFANYQRRGLDAPAIAARVSKGERYIAQRLKLLELTEDEKEALAKGRIQLGTALELACLPRALDPAARAEALPLVSNPENVLTVKEARARLTRRFYLVMAQAPFDLADATLVAQAGACTACPKRTSTQMALTIEGLDESDRCGDPACWKAKSEADWQRRADAARAAGVRVLDTKAAKKADADAARAVLQSPNMVRLDHECDLIEDPTIAAQIEKLEHELEVAAAADDDDAAVRITAQLDELEKRPVPTWRDVLGAVEAAPVKAPILVREDTYNGSKAYELVDRETAYSALDAARERLADRGFQLIEGTQLKPAAPAPAAAENGVGKRDTEMRDERKLAERVEEIFLAKRRAALVEHAEKTPPRPGIGFWRSCIAFALDGMGWDAVDGIASMCAARGWAVDVRNMSDPELGAFVFDKAQRMTEAQLRGLLIDVLHAIAPSGGAAAMKELGLSEAPLRAAATREAKKPPPAPAAEKKKGAKPKAKGRAAASAEAST